jgi:hypothetical protein
MKHLKKSDFGDVVRVVRNSSSVDQEERTWPCCWKSHYRKMTPDEDQKGFCNPIDHHCAASYLSCAFMFPFASTLVDKAKQASTLEV